jgi:hypothetical protein
MESYKIEPAVMLLPISYYAQLHRPLPLQAQDMGIDSAPLNVELL